MTISTIREVNHALSSLGLQAAPNTLKAISDTCRDFFLGRLEAAVAVPKDEKAQTFIANFLRCFAPGTRANLSKFVDDPTSEQIAAIASRQPVTLLSAIGAAMNEQHPKHAESLQWLANCFKKDSKPLNVVKDAPPAEKPPVSMSLFDKEKQAAVEISATAQPAPPKEYASCHVYGSSYALCFNLTDWDGKPGIMVDAAVSVSTKAYDWKNAVHLWLNANELGGILAVLRRYIPAIDFRAHGTRNEKSFSIARQDGFYHIKVTSKGLESHAVRAVKLMPGQVTELTVLIMKALLASYPGIPADQVLASIETAYAGEKSA